MQLRIEGRATAPFLFSNQVVLPQRPMHTDLHIDLKPKSNFLLFLSINSLSRVSKPITSNKREKHGNRNNYDVGEAGER
jgi:hypothetical protein